jgi:hypothetical protein
VAGPEGAPPFGLSWALWLRPPKSSRFFACRLPVAFLPFACRFSPACRRFVRFFNLLASLPAQIAGLDRLFACARKLIDVKKPQVKAKIAKL